MTINHCDPGEVIQSMQARLDMADERIRRLLAEVQMVRGRNAELELRNQQLQQQAQQRLIKSTA